jgi:hypothetical protein
MEEPLEISKRKWGCITMDLREIEWEVFDWIHLAQDRDLWLVSVNTVMNIRVP